MPEGSYRFRVGSGNAADDGACLSVLNEDGSGLTCTCRQTGAIAVLRFRTTPATNLLAFQRGVSLLEPDMGVAAWSGWFAIGLAYMGLMLVAAHLDAQTLYITTAHPSHPLWLKPRPFSVVSELLVTARLRTSVARIFHVYPGHTLYTRAQLLHVLACSCAFSLFSIVAFLGRGEENCADLAKLIAFLAVAISSLLGTAVRLLFRLNNVSKRHHHQQVYYANKRARAAALAKPVELRCNRAGMMEGAPRSDDDNDNGSDAGHGGVALPNWLSEGPSNRLALPPPSPPPSPSQSPPTYASMAAVRVELGGERRVGAPASVPKLIGRLQSPSIEESNADRRSHSLQPGGAGGDHEAHEHFLRRILLQRAMPALEAGNAGRARVAASEGRPAGTSGRQGGAAAHGSLRLASAWQLSTQSGEGVAIGVTVMMQGQQTFVPASRIRGSLCSQTLTVEYMRASLPQGLQHAPTKGQVHAPRPRRTPQLLGWSAAGMAVWAVSVLLLVAAVFGTLVALQARARLPTQLQASPVDDASWRTSVGSAFGISLLQSLLVVDGVKVLCLFATSKAMLARMGLQSKRMERFAKPVRRLHKIMDVIL